MEIIPNFKIGVLIPCYNVEKTIFNSLNSFSNRTWDEIDLMLLIDNCSTDSTIKFINKFINTYPSKKNKIKIIQNNTNLGLGGTQKRGYDFWLKNKFTHSMVIHSDLQCDPEKIVSDFILNLKKRVKLDIIFASRFHKNSILTGYSFLRVLVNKFFNFLTHILTSVKNSDSGCGIVFYNNKALETIDYKKLTNGPQFNPQINILLGRNKNLIIEEIPLSWKDSEAGSSINAIKYCYRLLIFLLIFRINLIFGKTSFFFYKK